MVVWSADVGEMENNRDTVVLIQMLQDNNWLIRCDAIEALSRVGDNQSVEPLVKALEDCSSLVRAQAAQALGRIGGSQAIGPLIKALSDSDAFVCVQAAQAQVEQAMTLNTAQEREKGEAQEATKQRDAALKALDEWLVDFRVIARIALEDNPQLLEALNIGVK